MKSVFSSGGIQFSSCIWTTIVGISAFNIVYVVVSNQ